MYYINKYFINTFYIEFNNIGIFMEMTLLYESNFVSVMIISNKYFPVTTMCLCEYLVLLRWKKYLSIKHIKFVNRVLLA